MTHDKKRLTQLNLPFCQTPAIDLPQDRQRELAAALVELLWSAAVANDPPAVQPPGDEA